MEMNSMLAYSKFPQYLQPYSGLNNGNPNYSITSGAAPVGYTTAMLQPRSTHQPVAVADKPRLSDYYGITPNSTSSGNGGFMPTDFEGLPAGMCHSVVELTPSESPPSDRGSSNNGDPPMAMVETSREAPVKAAASEPEKNLSGTNGTSSSPPAPAAAGPSTAHGITVNLLDKELWQVFKSLGNEMIVTKPGRRLFPALLVGIRGLELYTEYTISLRFSSADPYRYKFLNLQWVSVGESEMMQNEDRQILCHPSSPNTGQFWMKKSISFKQVKITHNIASKFGDILLHTMHKYVMELVIKPEDQPEIIIPLPDTEFMAVTAYQNSEVTKLKIEKNPFAKGFRDRANAGCPHPSTLPLPSLFGSPYGNCPPLLQSLPAYHIPPFPAIREESSQNVSSTANNGFPALPSLPAYPQPPIPPPYPYYPPTRWPSGHNGSRSPEEA